MDKLMTPTKAVNYLQIYHGIKINMPMFYTMISRNNGPEVIYFRHMPKFTMKNLDEWVKKTNKEVNVRYNRHNKGWPK